MTIKSINLRDRHVRELVTNQTLEVTKVLKVHSDVETSYQSKLRFNVGHILYVREPYVFMGGTAIKYFGLKEKVLYKADNLITEEVIANGMKGFDPFVTYFPAAMMPKEFSRYKVEVVKLKIVRKNKDGVDDFGKKYSSGASLLKATLKLLP